MSWSRPSIVRPLATLNGGNMGASINSEWIDLDDCTALSIEINYTNTNTPVGNFVVQLTNDTALTPTSLTADDGGLIAVDSSLTALFNFDSKPKTRYLRVRYARTSDGSGAIITANIKKELKS